MKETIIETRRVFREYTKEEFQGLLGLPRETQYVSVDWLQSGYYRVEYQVERTLGNDSNG